MASAFVPERIHAHNITHFDCQISLGATSGRDIHKLLEKGKLSMKLNYFRLFRHSFSPNGKTLASVSWDKTVRLWNVKTGAHLRTLTGYTGRVHSVAFSPNGRTLASTGADKIIRLWDPAKGTHKHDLIGHTAEVHSVSFSPDGRTLASGGWDATIRLWDPATGTHKQTLRRRTDRFSNVAFTPDGQILVSVSGREIRLWDLSAGIFNTETNEFSNRGKRKGFIWGIGIGTGTTSYTQ